jgi:subtilase family serine protease
MQNKNLVLAALLSSAMLFSTPAWAIERHSLHGHVPAVIHNLPSTGTLPRSTQLNLVIGLPLRNSQILSNLLQQIYNPTSPQYRQYLTPDQFTEMFGPTEQDYQTAIAFAKSNNLTVRGLHENRLLVDVSGAAGDIQQAFHVELQTYQHPTESRAYYAPGSEPSVESNIPVLDVSGLSNFRLPHPKNRRAVPTHPLEYASPKSGSGPGGEFIGSDYRLAYLPGVTLTGSGQSVGLVEFDGFYASDITAYEHQAALPEVPLKIVLLDGFKGIPTRGPQSGNSEVALDIDMAISMAPGLSQVVVYEAGPNGFANDILSAMSTNIAVKQFSCSWTFGTTPRTTMDQLFQKLAAQGQTFFDASGDSGAYSGSIDEPDDDPYLTSVGGTVLSTSGSGEVWVSEAVWNVGDGTNSSSGGFSKTYAIPMWQQGISMSANHGSTTFRNIPDVAMTADNIFIVADNGMQEVTGGTSAAAPLWAGLIALVNQEAAANGLPAVGFINPAIYAIGKGGGYLAAFDDITFGNNTNSSTDRFQAVPGYDLCTGWGSPAGGSLIHALAKPDNLTIIPGRGFVANGPTGGPHKPLW